MIKYDIQTSFLSAFKSQKTKTESSPAEINRFLGETKVKDVTLLLYIKKKV